jgi:oligopeptide transport system substrate-binding protein
MSWSTDRERKGMRTRFFGRFVVGAAAGAMLLSVAACGSSSTDARSGASGSSRPVISVNNSEPQNGLIPSDTNEMGGGKVIRYLFEGLVSFDAKGRQHMEVARSITPNADATRYTIALKKGWRFTNGEPVTSRSFARAWSFAADAKNAQKTSNRFSTIAGYDQLQKADADPDAQLSGLHTPDDYTLIVDMNQPDSVFTTKLAHQSYFPLPSVAYKDMKKFGQAPIGDGPYSFASWSHNRDIVIKPNKSYRGSRTVANGGIEFRVYTSEDSAYSDVLSGNLDVLDQVPQSEVASFRGDSSVTAYSQPGSTFQSFIIPERLAHFGSDQEGRLRRQAISMAIDRGQIAKKLYNGTVTAATDFTSPLVPEYATKLAGGGVLSHNARKARELWGRANSIKPWSGGFRVAYNADGGNKEWVDAVCNQIKNTLGIDAQGESYATFSDLRQRVSDRSITTAFRSGWMLDYPSAEDYLNPLYASSAADGRGSNDGDYTSRDFDGALANALSQTDAARRTQAFTKAQEILIRDLPSIPLWYANVAAVSATGVRNVAFDYTNLPTYNTITK